MTSEELHDAGLDRKMTFVEFQEAVRHCFPEIPICFNKRLFDDYPLEEWVANIPFDIEDSGDESGFSLSLSYSPYLEGLSPFSVKTTGDAWDLSLLRAVGIAKKILNAAALEARFGGES